jgi:SAM-dependent methyltransferase
VRDYAGWLRRDVFAGPEYVRLMAELERAQYDFIIEHRDRMNADGSITLAGRHYATGDGLFTWSRQYEYAYTAANLDPEDRDVLDVGSAFTFFPFWLAKRGHQVMCSDVLDLSTLYAGTGLRFVQDDITASGIEQSFDCVYCTSVLEHIPDKQSAVRNLMRLVRPGGKLVLTLDCALDRKPGDTPTIEQIYWLLAEIGRHFHPLGERVHFERTEDLVTTEQFYEGRRWRLPWKDVGPQGLVPQLKRAARAAITERRSLAVFLGTWRRGESGPG